MAGPTRVRALYEGGVFKPLVAMNLPERVEVELTVTDRAGFGEWWRAHSARMQKRTAGITPGEIESDVDLAIAEVRAERMHGK